MHRESTDPSCLRDELFKVQKLERRVGYRWAPVHREWCLWAGAEAIVAKMRGPGRNRLARGQSLACASREAQWVKNLPAVQETGVRSPGLEGPLEKGMATHSSILAWEIPWTEEPLGLQSTSGHKSWTQLSDKPELRGPRGGPV